MPTFTVGEYYTRKDVYRIVNVPDAQQGGNWDTGYTRYNSDSYVFANVGTAGRTGHDHPNRFDGNDLEWYGKKGSKLSHDSIQSLIYPKRKVYIFARKDSDDTQFVYIGNGKVKSFEDASPVFIVWQFNDSLENHPEILSEEESEPDKLIEGAVKQVFVNVYERNPIARKKCIEHHGCQCSVCNFNFYEYYGEVGKDFIHVHHLKPLYEVGREYEVDAVEDLRPVCPNCHAMLHKRKPAFSIEELKMMIRDKEVAIPHLK
ncbi:restriction endonuclease [Paenibacillus macquariensis subsp. macquariensis]|nr:restriction endonuclease [Paenibacillus macquariensis subsp. macquariensis]